VAANAEIIAVAMYDKIDKHETNAAFFFVDMFKMAL
jgi:hypothetical protein